MRTMFAGTALQLGLEERASVRRRIPTEPRELLSRFDCEHDLQMRPQVTLGVLRALSAHESEDLAVRVGAAWAHILHADRTDVVRDGVAWIDRSRGLVAQLEGSRQASDDPFAAYVLARWYAAVGQIHLRSGDPRAARIALTAAAKRATRKDLWFCRPDILTNLLRAQLEERKQAGAEEPVATAVRRFSRLREVMNSLAGRHGIDLGAVTPLAGELARYLSASGPAELGASPALFEEVIGICNVPEARRRCEMLRGLINLHFQRSLLLAPNPSQSWAGDRERSRELAWWCARAAFGVRDRLRLNQVLHHISSLGA